MIIYTNVDTAKQVKSSMDEAGKPDYLDFYIMGHHDVYFYLKTSKNTPYEILDTDTFKLVITEKSDWTATTPPLQKITTGFTIVDAAGGIIRIADLYLNHTNLVAYMDGVGDDGVRELGIQLSKNESEGDKKLWQGFITCHGDRDTSSEVTVANDPEYLKATECEERFNAKEVGTQKVLDNNADNFIVLGDASIHRSFIVNINLDDGSQSAVYAGVVVRHDGTDAFISNPPPQKGFDFSEYVQWDADINAGNVRVKLTVSNYVGLYAVYEIEKKFKIPTIG